MNKKKYYRKHIIKRIQELSEDEYNTKNTAIFEVFKSWYRTNGIETGAIGTYISMRKEVSTKSINEFLLLKKKDLYVPYIINNNDIGFSQYTSNTQLKQNKFGIFEPIRKNKTDQPFLDVMLFIIPAVGINKNGFRLGFGKGYYDRFFNKYNFDNVIKIGLQFEFQIGLDFDNNQYDLKFDYVITDKKIIK